MHTESGALAVSARHDALYGILGTTVVEKLYIQLLFDCNFRCRHCFQGRDLGRPDALTPEQFSTAVRVFRDEYGCGTVCLLGGEPFMHDEFSRLASMAKTLGLIVEVCTNGYQITDALNRCHNSIDFLRVSIDGPRHTHDRYRRPGSFDEAMKTLAAAEALGVSTGVTCTVTADNIAAVPALHAELANIGVRELVLHRLRIVGNASRFGVADISPEQAHTLAAALDELADSPIVRIDSDLRPESSTCSSIPTGCTQDQSRTTLERVELAPDGRLFLSCKAVGSHSNAFALNLDTGDILFRPNGADEVSLPVPQVRYL